MDLHWRHPIWLQLVGSLALSNGQMTIWEHQMPMLEIQQANTLNASSPGINIIHHPGMVTCLCSPHFWALPSSTTLRPSTWHQDHNQALVQPRDIWAMGQHGKHMISSKVVVEDLKCSPSAICRSWAIISRVTPSGSSCCTVACARVVECAQAYAKVCLLYRETRHVTST